MVKLYATVINSKTCLKLGNLNTFYFENVILVNQSNVIIILWNEEWLNELSNLMLGNINIFRFYLKFCHVQQIVSSKMNKFAPALESSGNLIWGSAIFLFKSTICLPRMHFLTGYLPRNIHVGKSLSVEFSWDGSNIRNFFERR